MGAGGMGVKTKPSPAKLKFWLSISLLFWPGGWVGGGFGGMESKTNSAPNSVRVGKLGLSLATRNVNVSRIYHAV